MRAERSRKGPSVDSLRAREPLDFLRVRRVGSGSCVCLAARTRGIRRGATGGPSRVGRAGWPSARPARGARPDPSLTEVSAPDEGRTASDAPRSPHSSSMGRSPRSIDVSSDAPHRRRWPTSRARARRPRASTARSTRGPQPRVHRLESSCRGCFCAQKPFSQNSLQQSLDVKHRPPRARHSCSPGACAFVTPVGFDPPQHTRAAATTTAETSCLNFMGASCPPSPSNGRAIGRGRPAHPEGAITPY
jgi:hypothetical protein